jgi:hypothetical protein
MKRIIRQILVFALIVTAFSTELFGKSKGNLSGELKSSYYKDWPLFHMYPKETDPRWTIDHVGPIGIGLDLLQPAFTMKISSIEAGSPAEQAGLKKGQYIDSINGKVLKDVDPRVILGNLITEAEATDGKLKMMVKDRPEGEAKEVVVQLEVLGSYNDTWPVNCEKSDKIVRKFADLLAKSPRSWGSVMFLLSTGEEKDLDVVRGWLSGKLKGGKQGFPWSIGYTGPAICEYYLRTGDESVLPAIKGMADYLTETLYNGSWMGRGGCNYGYMAGGHMNAAGVPCLTFLLLAKECGVDVDEHTLQSVLYHFYRYAGHRNVSYGDGVPEGGGVDNGKSGKLAFAMAAAASLSPDGENSVYAKARDINASKSFYNTSWLFHGHTGGGIGELWRGAAPQIIAEKRPNMYRSFMDERRWMYELARRYDGAFGWPSGWNVSYGSTCHDGGKSWGNYIPLVYTINRKNLRIFGAPPTKYSKTYTLPKRPWGTEADEAFYSLEAGEYKPGKKQELSKETLPTHASWPLLRKLKNTNVSDDDLLMFAYHPVSIVRDTASGAIKDLGREHLIMPLLTSNDPRARRTGVNALGDELSDEEIKVLGAMVSDPEESWWVNMAAMNALARAPAEKIAPYFDSLKEWLGHEDWWLRKNALTALTPLVSSKDYYKKILPEIGEMIATNTRAVALFPIRNIIADLQEADPEIQKFGIDILSQAYSRIPDKMVAPGGLDMQSGVDYLVRNVARYIAKAPGGYDALYEVGKKRFPNEPLPHKEIFLKANPDDFGPNVQEALKPVVLDYLIPEFIGAYNHIATNSDLLKEEANSQPFNGNYYYREPRMEELVRLYQRIGIHEYDWKTFGPDLAEINWNYYTYDPPEKKLWEGGWRYRKVSVPNGMENWYKPEFDPKAAGWKTGNAPFASMDWKPYKGNPGCDLPFCRCNEPGRTLWDKEVLLLNTKLQLPEMKAGHRYRVVVGGMSHNNSGDGYEIYVDGKLLEKREAGVKARAGGKAISTAITKDMWETMQNEPIVAAKGFCSIPPGRRSPGVPRNHFSIWVQEMKCPEITKEMIIRGKSLQPLLCASWQSTKDEDDKYLYDEKIVANDAVLGMWKKVAQVAAIVDFDPDKMTDLKPEEDNEKEEAFPLDKIEIKAKGKTDDEFIIWTGEMILDLNRYMALKMETMEIDGEEYLFIESGGFNKSKPEGWMSQYTVFAKK